jgi:hypothetical protein
MELLNYVTFDVYELQVATDDNFRAFSWNVSQEGSTP